MPGWLAKVGAFLAFLAVVLFRIGAETDNGRYIVLGYVAVAYCLLTFWAAWEAKHAIPNPRR